MGVRCSQLTVEFSTPGYVVRPFEDLELEVGDGQLGLLLGTSGSGKTTLLSVLAGILTPLSGSVTVDGLEVTKLRAEQLAAYRRRKVGIVFQAFNLLPSLTASENVQVPLRAAGMSPGPARRRAEELLGQFDMGQCLDHKGNDMSGGQQQRVAMARALALDPPVLLADEPTAHLDHRQVERVVTLLKRIAEEGRTVIVSTHDERLTPLADRIEDMTPSGSEAMRLVREVHLEPGQTLFNQGDRGELVYVVQEGTLQITRELPDRSRRVMQTVGVGQYVGELGPMLKIPRTATVRALGPARVIGLSGPDFRMRIRSGELPLPVDDQST